MNEKAFLQDLAMLMSVAGLTSVIFAHLRWPKAIGYILAGILLSSHTWGGAFLADESSVRTIAQLGVVFLMLIMGLDFSLAEMKRIRRTALPTAAIDTAVMVWIGYTLAHRALGWPVVPSLFLGVAVCDSSTTLLAKVIDEMQWRARPAVKYIVGTSVCEDIVCVGLVALATGVAQSGRMSFGAAGVSLGGLLLFFAATIVFGFVLVPRLLESVARRCDDETLLLTLLGLCFFVTYIAFRLDYSLALGAFLVGVLGSASEVRLRLRRLIEPLRSMFAAVFFVSVGLLVDPAACWRHAGAIALVSFAVMAGKFANCTLGALVSGRDVKTAVQMGMGLAQIGEFAFMVALLYLGLTGDAQSALFPVVAGVSLLTTLLNPAMIKLSDPAGAWVERHCPPSVARGLAWWRALLERVDSHASEGSPHRRALRTALVELAVVAALAFAVALGASMLDGIEWRGAPRFFADHRRLFFALAADAVLLAMFAPVAMLAERLSCALAGLLAGTEEKRAQTAFRDLLRWTVTGVVYAGFFLEVVMINVSIAPDEIWARWAIAGFMAAGAIFGWRVFLRFGRRATRLFREAVGSDERLRRLSRELVITVPGDAVEEIRIGGGFAPADATLGALGVRARTGATVVAVRRGGKTFRAVGPDFALAPGDTVVAMGGAGCFAALRKLLAEAGA